MRKWIRRAAVPVAAAATVLLLGALPAAEATGGKVDVLTTVMTGEQEVPDPGDENGRGVFAGVVKGDRLCYVIVANRIETPLAAHIHTGPAGVAGGVVVGLDVPDKVGRGCISAVPDDQNSTATLTQSELAAILENPSDFYVNVHNEPFPDGAIRGQLR